MSAGIISDAITAYRVWGQDFGPNEMQGKLYDLITGSTSGCAELLKAPTGSGKTEAVVIPALEAQRRLFLIYPARSLLQDQEERIAKMLVHRSLSDTARVYSLVVDTGAEMYRRAWRNGQESRKERRHLLHGDVVLTTLDKFLYRFFGFGEERKGYTYPLRLRYGRRPLFCFDEAHTYDDVSFTNFVDLVRAIGFNAQAPRDLIVMTATMPKSNALAFEELLTTHDYTTQQWTAKITPWIQYRDKAFELCETPHDATDDALREDVRLGILAATDSYHRTGRRTIIVLEEVRDAVAVYHDLKERLSTTTQPILLYHGRQTASVRTQTYATLKERDKRKRGDSQSGYLLVTTSAIEVGCDLDADLLITQLCNPEQLIQRAGRCNRRGETLDGRIVLVGGSIPEYLRTIPQRLMPTYLDQLNAMAISGIFDVQPLLELERRSALTDYRVRTMFTMLYEYVYQAERANKPLHDKGLVITRSWEPTVTLATAEKKDGSLENELQIGIRSCCASSQEKIDTKCQVFVRRYDEEQRRWILQTPTRSGSAYGADIVIIAPQYCDSVEGYVQPPRVFTKARPNSYRRGVVYTPYVEEAPTDPSKAAPADTSSTAKEAKPKSVYWWYYDELYRASEAEEDTPEEKPESDNSADELGGDEEESDERYRR